MTQQLELAQRCGACHAELGPATLYCRRCGRLQDGARLLGQPVDASGERAAVLLPTRPSTSGLIACGLTLGVLLAITVPVLVVRAAFFGPNDVVARYFAALADREADTARGQLTAATAIAGNPLLTAEALRDPGYTPPDDASVKDVDVDGEEATAEVTYRVAGAQMAAQLKLVRNTHLLDRWRIENGLLELPLPFSPSSSFLVAGRPVAPNVSSQSTPAFPGAYRVTHSGSSLIEIPPTTLIAGGRSNRTIMPTITANADREIRAKVRAWLDECARQTVAAPPGCPFSHQSFGGKVVAISWKISDDPDLELRLNETGTIQVEGTGSARATGRTDSTYSPTFDEPDTFTIRGTAIEENGAIRFVPGTR